MSQMKITVLKRMTNMDLVKEHMGSECQESTGFPCPQYRDGQTFIFDPWSGIPDGFCENAWADIHRNIQFVAGNGRYPRSWVLPLGSAIACCTDGYRPVVFKIELLDESSDSDERS